MPAYQCPRCHSHDVRDGHSGLAGATLYEFSCRACGHYDDRRSDAPDIDAWWQSWSTPPAASASLDALLAAVIATPDDDGPRRAYADAIAATDPARAELIALQLTRAAAERDRGAPTGTPSARERELVRTHGDGWARALTPYARPIAQPRPDPGWDFERGFVEFLRVEPATLLAAGALLAGATPLRHLDLTAGPGLRDALQSPVLRGLRSLGAPGARLDDDDAIALAASDHLTGVVWLDLRDNAIGSRGMRALAASAAIRAIPFVLLGGNPGDPSEQRSLDWDGSVADAWLPDLGLELEAAYGPIPWLRPPLPRDRPDRYHA